MRLTAQLLQEKKRRLYDKNDFPIAEYVRFLLMVSLLFDWMVRRYNMLCQRNMDLDAAIVKAKSQIAFIA